MLDQGGRMTKTRLMRVHDDFTREMSKLKRETGTGYVRISKEIARMMKRKGVKKKVMEFRFRV